MRFDSAVLHANWARGEIGKRAALGLLWVFALTGSTPVAPTNH